MTEAEFDALEAKVTAIRSQWKHCGCACKCEYPLWNAKSEAALTCFSCRSGLHFGSRRVGVDMEAAQ